MDRRSAWTGQRTERLIEVRLPSVTRWGTPSGERAYFVEPEHEAELRQFIAFAVRSARPALVAYATCTALTVWGATTSPTHSAGRWLLVTGLALLGGSVIAFPFATPETVQALGIRRSRTIARLAGAGLVSVAALTAVVYAWMG